MKKVLFILLSTLMSFTCIASGPIRGWKVPKVKLTHKEAIAHSLLVYGGAYLQYEWDSEASVPFTTKKYSGYVYMIIDRNTDTFTWLDCSDNTPNRKHTIYGECKISGDTLYISPKYSSLMDKNGIRQFNGSIGMIYYNIDAENHVPMGEVDANNIPNTATRLNMYKFLINKNTLVDITGLLRDESEFFNRRRVLVLPNMTPRFHPAWNPEIGCISDFKIQWVKLYRIKLSHKKKKVDCFHPIPL